MGIQETPHRAEADSGSQGAVSASDTSYDIRKAQVDDHADLLPLFEQLDRTHRDRLPYLYRAPDGPAREGAYYESLIADPEVGLFVARVDGEPAGLVVVEVRVSRPIPILVPRRYASVNSLIVDAGHRRLGVGRALMARAQRWAREQGASSIELGVWSFNRQAIEFYRALGYQTVHLRMSKPLD